jgi:hypothetical protein
MKSLSKWLELVKVLAPTILTVVPHADRIGPFVPLVLHGIEVAEGMKGATGADKKAAAIDLIATGLLGANATGTVKIDVEGVTTAASSAIDAIITAANGVHKAHVTNPE